MNTWKVLPEYHYKNHVIKEVQCPVCKHKETYEKYIPNYCYICEERREI